MGSHLGAFWLLMCITACEQVSFSTQSFSLIQQLAFKGSEHKCMKVGYSKRVAELRSDGKVDRSEAMGEPCTSCLERSESSLEFWNMHGRVVSVSPRLTFLMQD